MRILTFFVLFFNFSFSYGAIQPVCSIDFSSLTEGIKITEASGQDLDVFNINDNGFNSRLEGDLTLSKASVDPGGSSEFTIKYADGSLENVYVLLTKDSGIQNYKLFSLFTRVSAPKDKSGGSSATSIVKLKRDNKDSSVTIGFIGKIGDKVNVSLDCYMPIPLD